MTEATSTTTAPIDAEFARTFAKRWLDAWNSRDPERVLELCADDISWDDPALAETVHGKEAVREFLVNTWGCFPDMTFEASTEPLVDAEGGRAAQLWELRGTMLGPALPTGFAPTGASVKGPGVDLYEFRDGLVSRYRTFYDLTDWLRQMGMMPPHGSRAERVAVKLQRLGARRQRKKNAKQRV